MCEIKKKGERDRQRKIKRKNREKVSEREGGTGKIEIERQSEKTDGNKVGERQTDRERWFDKWMDGWMERERVSQMLFFSKISDDRSINIQ